MQHFFDLLALTVYLAMIGVVVASTNVQGIISSFFKGFAGLLTAGK